MDLPRFNRLNHKQSKPNTEYVNPEPGIKATSMYDSFLAWKDEDVVKFLIENRFTNPKKLKDGSWVATMQLIYTLSVCTDITPMTPYAYRWCFKDPEEAMYFLENIQEFDEIPERRSSLKGHRYHGLDARLIAYDELGLKKW